jgi:hypothetical protein
MKDLVKVFFAFVMAVMMSTSVSAQHHDDTHHKTTNDDPVITDDPTITKDGKAGVKTDDGLLYGVDFKGGETMAFSEVIQSKDKLDGQVVTVKGYVSDVCAKAGCWLVMTEGDKSIRVLTMHDFLVPTGYAGKNAIINGTFKVRAFSEEEEEHYNEESATPKETIEKREETYEIEATGIKFVD